MSGFTDLVLGFGYPDTGSSAPTPVTSYWHGPYWNPAYWDHGYWFNTLVPFPQALAYGPDNTIWQAIQDTLVGLGDFARDGVDFGAPSEVLARSARQYPCAAILPGDFQEPSRYDFGDKIRTVTYTITLVVRDEEPRRRLQQLDGLTARCQNALDGRSLAGLTFPVLTKLERGRYQATPNHPEQRLILSGSFTYEVVGYGARDESLPDDF